MNVSGDISVHGGAQIRRLSGTGFRVVFADAAGRLSARAYTGLADFNIVSPSDEQMIRYDGSSGKWTNQDKDYYTITQIDDFFEPTVAGKKQIDWGNVINKTSVNTINGLEGGGSLDSNLSIGLTTTGVSAGSYGSASQVGIFTVDARGRLTNAGNTSIQIAESQVTDLIAHLAAKQETSEKGQALGYVPLNASAKIDTTYLPDSILGQVSYQGTWNAATNSPAIPAASSGNKGYYYVASSDVGSGHGYSNVPAVDFKTGDWIISNGSVWEKVDNTDAVPTVFGRTGNILAVATDYSGFYVRHDTASQGLNSTQQSNARANINAVGKWETWGTSFTANGNITAAGGTLTAGTITARGTAATVFLTHEGGTIQSRTASEVLSDIGVSGSFVSKWETWASQMKATNGVQAETAGTDTAGSTSQVYIGNSSAGSVLRHTASRHFAIDTYSSGNAWLERLRIERDGNVGIGTSTPASGYKLTVAGNILASGGSLTAGVIAAKAGAATVFLTHEGGEIKTRTAAEVLSDIGAGTSLDSYWSKTGTTVYYSGGSVGIGTSSPSFPLSVVGNIQSVTAGSDTPASTGLYIGNGTAGSFLRHTASRHFAIDTYSTGGSWVERLLINRDGAVTIHSLSGSGTRVVTADGSGNLSASSSYPTGSGASGRVAFWNGASTLSSDADMTYNSTTNILTVAGDVVVSSDRRLKKNIRPLQNALERLFGMRGVIYDWRKGNRPANNIGWIAQNVQEHAPELVTTNDDGKLSVRYMASTALLGEAIKESHTMLSKRLADQASEISWLRSEIERISCALTASK